MQVFFRNALTLRPMATKGRRGLGTNIFPWDRLEVGSVIEIEPYSRHRMQSLSASAIKWTRRNRPDWVVRVRKKEVMIPGISIPDGVIVVTRIQ